MSEVSPATTTATRRGMVLGLLLVAGLVLVARIADLQINKQAFLKSQGDARFLREVDTPAHRGRILDRNNQPLAVSAPVASVWAVPGELAAQREHLPSLASVLGIDVADLAGEIEKRLERKFMYIKRHVQPEVADKVAALGIGGVYLRREYRRYYPSGEAAAQVVGFTNIDDVGQEGMELAFENWLRGVSGRRRVIRDRLGRVIEGVGAIRQPRAGRDLILSLDNRVQFVAYRALKSAVRHHGAKGGSVVVMDVRTGEVLAMANQPGYNPNNRTRQTTVGLRNRAVTDVFEPGSTIKPLTVAAALESGELSNHSMIDTHPGYFKVGRLTVRDHHNYGRIDLATVIKKSSNVGASKVALSIPPASLWSTLAGVGFGQNGASGYPGEASGTLTHFDSWGDIHRATLAYGYGLSVTALQLAQAYASLANGGLAVPASFQRLQSFTPGRRVMSAEVAAEIRRLLEQVTATGGTGRRARVAEFRVAGKTGTVKKATAGGYADDRYTALFVGMMPASKPRLVAVVTVDEPRGEKYYGGQVAAPVFAQVMQGAARILGLAPDDPKTLQRLASVSIGQGVADFAIPRREIR